MMVIMLILPLFAIALLMAPLIPVYTGVKTGQKAKNAFIFHICAFFGVMLLLTLLPLGGMVSAASSSLLSSDSSTEGLKYIAAALATGIAGIGSGIAVGNGAPAAIGACSEDPKAFGKAMIFVALGEGIAIYGFVISFLILFAA